MKEIDGLPLENVINQYLYQLNADIQQLVEIRIEEFLTLLGEVLGATSTINDDMNNIIQHLEAREVQWELISEKCRFQSGNRSLITILEQFVAGLKPQIRDMASKQDKTP